MQAIILAGGFGTRIRSTIGELPKPMAPINWDGKTIPFLEVLLLNLRKHGIKKAVIAVHYLKDTIIHYFGTTFNNIKIEYAIEKEPLGTGGAIVNASKYIDDHKFLILNGDTFLECNYKDLFCKDSTTIALKHLKDCTRYGKVVVKDNKIIKFTEKGVSDEGLINGGVYLIDKNDIAELPRTAFSFETDFLHKKNNIDAFITDGYFIDIGIPEDYNNAKDNLCKNVYF